MTRIERLFARMAIALALGLMVLAVLDERNPVMGFLTSTSSKIFLALTCVFCIVTCIFVLRKKSKKQQSDE